MSESSAAETPDKEAKQDVTVRKRVRHRKKLLYEKILKQMEFYFGDANLTKDRLLSQMIKDDPYVPLDIFLKFNKIRSMTHDVNDIAKAMKHSTLLELSDDRTKVRRKIPLLPYDADSRTVYVESIPATASREWLERVFSDYGVVAYISLPKFKDSQRIKGYGFIEFHTAEDAQKCINVFTKMGCKLPTCTPPEELSSIKTFSVEDPPETVQDKFEGEPPKKRNKKMKDKKTPKNLELKCDQESDAAEKKLNTPVEEDRMSTATEELEEIKHTNECTETSHDEGKPGEGEDGTPRKKKRRKKANKENTKKIPNVKDVSRDALLGLQVLSKCEWKSLRNKYLNLQRANMKALKRELRARHYGLPPPAPPARGNSPPRHSHTEGLLTEDRTAGAEEEDNDVYATMTLPQPCLDVRDTKRQLKSNEHILHVEVREGQSEVVLRFGSKAAAEEWVSERRGARLLVGDEEAAQREARQRAKQDKKHRLRGRQRLQARAQTAAAGPAPPQPSATHIRFDEDEQHH